MVNVDFEFFDPNPEVDYLGLKRLATQLLQGDAEAMQLQDFADLVLSQPGVGTTVKCDGKESDPAEVEEVLPIRIDRGHRLERRCSSCAGCKRSCWHTVSGRGKIPQRRSTS